MKGIYFIKIVGYEPRTPDTTRTRLNSNNYIFNIGIAKNVKVNLRTNSQQYDKIKVIDVEITYLD
jgi:hypothetical protein